MLGRLPNIFAASIPGQENDLASPQALLKDEFYQAAFSKYYSEDAFLKVVMWVSLDHETRTCFDILGRVEK